MMKCRSFVPSGALSTGAFSVTPPLIATSRLLPLERTISVLPAGTGSAASDEPASLFVADRMTGGLPV